MRIVKNASVRKNEILDAAALLFAEKGFDDTSVADILSAVGIAKGTLYHHFKSKEDMMDALIERQTESLLSAAAKAAADKSRSVQARMLQTILSLHMDAEQTEGPEMIQHLHKPQNALMQQKTKRIILRRVPPILSSIISDGVAQGLFQTPYPLECMEMSLCYLDAMLDDNVFELTDEQRLNKIRAFLSLLERLLGAEDGALASFEAAFQKDAADRRGGGLHES